MNNLQKSFSSIAILFGSLLFAKVASCATPIYKVNEAEGAFLQLPLSHEVFRYSQQPNFQDLVVLDAEHNPLPYRLITVISDQQPVEEKFVSNSLRFFPVAVDATPDTLRKLHSTQVSVRGNSVQVSTSDKTLDNSTPEFYLVDVSQLDHDLTSLSIDWVAQANNQYLEIELEATRNLQDWFSLARSTLVQINQQEHNLKRNRIEVKIAKKEYEFLRIRVLRGAENLQFTQVIGELKIGTVVEKPVKEMWGLKGYLAKIQTTVYLPSSHSKAYPVAAWEFVRDEATPIDTLVIDFGTATYGDSAKIFSRTRDNQNWQLQHQGIWFNAQVGSEWQKSNPINIYSNRDKYWRVELNETAKNNLAPSLVVGWQPMQLQIITNNKPPYVLAIDSNKNITYNRDQVFAQIMAAATPVWVPASLSKLNVQPEVISGEGKPVDWKQWLFWVALLAAVGVLLAFSLKLFRQLKMSNAS